MQPKGPQDAAREVELNPKTLQAPYWSEIDWTQRLETDRELCGSVLLSEAERSHGHLLASRSPRQLPVTTTIRSRKQEAPMARVMW